MYSIPFFILFKVLALIMKEYVLVLLGFFFFQLNKYLCPPGPGDTERNEARGFPQGVHESGR